MKKSTVIGAGCGGFLFVILGIVARIDHGAPWTTEYMVKYHLLPATIGIVIGASIGWGLAVARCRQAVSRVKFVFGWSVLGGWVAVLVPAGLIFLWAWVRGEVFDLAGIAHHRPAPMSLSAASEALGFVFVFAVFLGLPLFAIGAIVGLVVAKRRIAQW